MIPHPSDFTVRYFAHKCKKCGAIIRLEKTGSLISAVHGGKQTLINSRDAFRPPKPSRKTIVCSNLVTRNISTKGYTLQAMCRQVVLVRTFKEITL